MPLRSLIRDARVVDGIAVTVGGLLALAFYAFTDSTPQNHDCTPIPYEIGARPTCMEIPR